MYTPIVPVRSFGICVSTSIYLYIYGTPLIAQSVKNLPAVQETWIPTSGLEVPWRRKWKPTPVLLPVKSHGQRSLARYRTRVARVGQELMTKAPPYIHTYIYINIYILYRHIEIDTEKYINLYISLYKSIYLYKSI